MSVHPERGFKCWPCCFQGGIRHLAELLGVAVKADDSDAGDFANSADSANEEADHKRRRQGILKILRECIPDRGRIAAYLENRGLAGAVPPMLKFHEALPYFETGQPTPASYFPAMVAMVLSPDGDVVAAHRTYLAPDGPGKAVVPEPKKLTRAAEPGATRGAAIRLGPAQDVIALTEGIESALAVMEATGMPAWAALSAGGLREVELPRRVRRVQIWGDHDAAGQDAAAEAAKRLRAEGREVRILLPPKAGMDWLDVLNEHGPEALQAALRDAKAVSAEKISDWPPVIPFREFNLPPFPLDALPEWVRDFVRAEAVTTQTPPDMAALLALSTLAVISARLVGST
jgi:putative DNA primase/helicase